MSHLIEPIVRQRIQDSIFYKQHLYLTNEQTILPVIVSNIKYIAGTDASGRPSPFILCLLRLLELLPTKEIVAVYLNQVGYNKFKYLTALVLFYVRLVFLAPEVYTIFDEYLKDYRRLRCQLKSPNFTEAKIPIHYSVTYMDSWADDLLNEERVCDLILPYIAPRQTLVLEGLVGPRIYDVASDGADSEGKTSEESDYQSDSD